MVVADGSNVMQFGEDNSIAGRRERLMRKRESRDAFTGKVGTNDIVSARKESTDDITGKVTGASGW